MDRISITVHSFAGFALAQFGAARAFPVDELVHTIVEVLGIVILLLNTFLAWRGRIRRPL